MWGGGQGKGWRERSCYLRLGDQGEKPHSPWDLSKRRGLAAWLSVEKYGLYAREDVRRACGWGLADDEQGSQVAGAEMRLDKQATGGRKISLCDKGNKSSCNRSPHVSLRSVLPLVPSLSWPGVTVEEPWREPGLTRLGVEGCAVTVERSEPWKALEVGWPAKGQWGLREGCWGIFGGGAKSGEQLLRWGQLWGKDFRMFHRVSSVWSPFAASLRDFLH